MLTRRMTSEIGLIFARTGITLHLEFAEAQGNEYENLRNIDRGRYALACF